MSEVYDKFCTIAKQTQSPQKALLEVIKHVEAERDKLGEAILMSDAAEAGECLFDDKLWEAAVNLADSRCSK